MLSVHPTDEPLPSAIGARYQVQELIGRGGMARVLRAVDRSTGTVVALKRMHGSIGRGRTLERSRDAFEREYRALSQLSHPRIVTVYEYGVQDERPFYTMELLDGGDLLERSPLPWRQACAVARDVCSALSLVHARRMVYRDLSPRNVRLTGDGTAKLIDFGAMAPMGSGRFAVCTPAVAPPEVVNLQSLDARTDLYSLGATLYQTLTGRAPYPARTFRQLPQLWAHPLSPPSALVDDLPEALDGLVMELLQLDPRLRPASAAEVSDRLCALAELQRDDQLVVSHAYLTTPVLVGRDQELGRMRRRIERLRTEQRGAALMVYGARGAGRSRLLDAWVLQAKTSGLLVARSDENDADGGAFGGARAIAEQLCAAVPECVLRAASVHWDLLSDLLPMLAELAPERSVRPVDAATRRHQALPALRDWLLEVTAERPLVLAVDDIERLDAESRTLFALLAEQAKGRGLLLLATRNPDAEVDCDALRLLAAQSREVALQSLSLKQTHALLASVFGEVPNLAALVQHVQEVSSGNPKACLRLCEHLLDRGIVRQQDGVWLLPGSLAGAGLPQSMQEALLTVVAELEPEARELATALALAPDRGFSFEECRQLAGAADSARVSTQIVELLRRGLMMPSGDHYRVAGNDWASALLECSETPNLVTLQRRIASVFEARDDGIRAARHRFACGDFGRGVDVLASHAERSSAVTNVDPEAYLRLLNDLPPEWLEVYLQALSLCEAQQRGPLQVYALRNRLLGFIAHTPLGTHGHTVGLARTLWAEAGLDLYASLNEVREPGERIKLAIEAAMARHAGREPDQRLFDPPTAMRHLARTVIAAIGNVGNSLDVAEWQALPSFAAFEPLSPGLSVTGALVRGFDARLGGRYERARAIYYDVLERIQPPHDAGLDETYVDSLRTGIRTVLGLLEASMGRPEAEQQADAIAHTALHGASALLIRPLARLWQGDVEAADRLQHEAELRRLEERRQPAYEPMALLWSFQAHAISGDLTRTRHGLAQIERVAKRCEPWKPALDWARAEYENIRGDHTRALELLDDALLSLPAGQHLLWPTAVASRVLTLCKLGRVQDAYAEGQAYLKIAEQAEIDYLAHGIRLPLALAAAALGHAEQARRLGQAVFDGFARWGVRGIQLGLAHENAAHVAITLKDGEAFEHHAERCAAVYHAYDNRALAARYERLMRRARRAGLAEGDDAPECAPEPLTQPLTSELQSQLTTLLSTCSGANECIVRSLELMVEHGGADTGYLVALIDGKPQLFTQTGGRALPAEIFEAAKERLLGEIHEGSVTLSDSIEAGAETWRTQSGDSYRPVMLSHYGSDGLTISGLALLHGRPGSILPEAVQVAPYLSRFIAGATGFTTYVVED